MINCPCRSVSLLNFLQRRAQVKLLGVNQRQEFTEAERKGSGKGKYIEITQTFVLNQRFRAVITTID
jgi:hypothetical protein